MPTAKGKITEIKHRDVDVKGEKKKKFLIRIHSSNVQFSGFGDCPWKPEQEVEFEYTIDEKEYTDQNTGEKKKFTFYNIKQPSKAAQAVEKAIAPMFEELIEILAMPKISVSIERTIQKKEFEPKKWTAFISCPIRTGDSAAKMIKILMDTIEAEINDRIKEDLKGVEGIKENPPAPAPDFKSAETGEIGQKSLIDKAMEKAGT